MQVEFDRWRIHTTTTSKGLFKLYQQHPPAGGGPNRNLPTTRDEDGRTHCEGGPHLNVESKTARLCERVLNISVMTCGFKIFRAV